MATNNSPDLKRAVIAARLRTRRHIEVYQSRDQKTWSVRDYEDIEDEFEVPKTSPALSLADAVAYLDAIE